MEAGNLILKLILLAAKIHKNFAGLGVPFLIKLQALASNFIKKETLAQMFSCEFCEISKNTFSTEHLSETASVDY